jgi:hypothetical protein
MDPLTYLPPSRTSKCQELREDKNKGDFDKESLDDANT